jgi:hypothetical protein
MSVSGFYLVADPGEPGSWREEETPARRASVCAVGTFAADRIDVTPRRD